MCSRKIPRSARHGLVLAEEVLRAPTPSPRPAGRPARPAASWFGSPRRTRLRAAVPTASASASETCPASSTKSVSRRPLEVRAREEPRRAREELEIVVEKIPPVGRPSRRSGPRSATPRCRARLLPAREHEALLARLALDLLEELVDRLVAQRGDAHALPARMSATAIFAPCHVLPEPGRALHEEVAARRARPASTGGNVESRSGSCRSRTARRDAARRRRGTRAQAAERVALLLVVDRLPGDQRARKRLVGTRLRPAGA